jgi:hypothetical protein
MKLSELIDYLNLLQQQEHIPDYVTAVKQLQSIAHVVENHSLQLETFAVDLVSQVTEVETAFATVQATLSDLRSQLLQLIAHFEKAQYQESQRLYEQEMCYETVDYILNRRLAIDDDSNILLRSRLRNYTDWRLPGMIIRPGLENFIEDLVPLDPLYLVDQNLELLDPSIKAFTLEYQRRLRPYCINDYRDNKVLWQLPDNQFGFVFAYNYFNYKPIEVFARYLTEIFAKLRPGGVCLFTFNDCDWAQGAALSERSFMCYTPGHVVKSLAEQTGFEILYQHRGLGDLAWLEIRRPGEIESIRGGQSLAKIIAHE